MCRRPGMWRGRRGCRHHGHGRAENANAAARVEPRREGYYNAIQIYPWSEGALYQVYAAVGQITTIALEPGENLTAREPIAAGDTGPLGDRRHRERKRSDAPSACAGEANPAGHLDQPVITTDRRIYMIELRAREALYMPCRGLGVSGTAAGSRATAPSVPVIRPRPRGTIATPCSQGDSPPWRPVSVFDDGRRVHVVFPRGIVQGEMPPCSFSVPTANRRSSIPASTRTS